jgi:hypothetical protein
MCMLLEYTEYNIMSFNVNIGAVAQWYRAFLALVI